CLGQACFFFSSRRRHTRSKRDWSSDVCSSDLEQPDHQVRAATGGPPVQHDQRGQLHESTRTELVRPGVDQHGDSPALLIGLVGRDRKSTRLNSSHVSISYAVFCLRKKKYARTV